MSIPKRIAHFFLPEAYDNLDDRYGTMIGGTLDVAFQWILVLAMCYFAGRLLVSAVWGV